MADEPSALDNLLREYYQTRRYSQGRPQSIRITPDGKSVLFLRSAANSGAQSLYEFDIASGEEKVLASADSLLGGKQESLSTEELARRERLRMMASGIARYELSDDASRVLVPLSGDLYLLERTSGEIRKLDIGGKGPVDPRFSPDAKSIAFVREGNLYVLEIESGKVTALTTDANDTREYGVAEFVAQEEMGRMHGYWWSPDGKQIAYQETDLADVELFYIADPANPAAAPQSWRYPRPGKNNARVRLGVVSAAGGETQWVDWDREVFPYLAKATWTKGAPLAVVVQNREQAQEQLLSVDVKTGTTKTLLEETDSAWVNLETGMPKWFAEGSSFLWTTERNGAWELERRDANGTLVATLTPMKLGYRSLVGIDRTSNTAIVAASPEPTETQLYRVSLDGTGDPKPMTSTPGMHWGVLSSKSGVYITGGKTLQGELPTRIFSAAGEQLGELKGVGIAPKVIPNVTILTVGENPAMRAAVIRPRGEEFAGKKLPVIVSVYGGPHSQTVTADASRYFVQQWFADHGYIVVSLDGRGTPGRGREWERAIKGNLIKAPLEDQVHGLKALAKQVPEMDMSRVGISGWSFGGYFAAMAVMQRPEVFHAGIAGAPVIDWHDYDTHYTERYMGLPDANAKGYDAANVLTYAPKLERPLLVVHGTADDNVYFLHSVKLVDRLFREGRPYDFLPLRGSTHMVAGTELSLRLQKTMLDYFDRHLREEKTGAE